MDKLLKAVDSHASMAKAAQEYLWKNPETGYKEWKAHAYLKAEFEKLGYKLVEAGNIPGFYADVDTGREGPTVLVMGEMDALVCRSHPDADPETGAVHACGHCCQVAGLLGLAGALTEPGVLDAWCGKIRLMAVPAEELIEVEYREQLRREGVIRYFGGKVEFMYRGFMDGVDIAMMIHSTVAGDHVGTLIRGMNGCVAKTITYHGKSAHAGGAPHNGINALYAANQGLSAINALRETFKDEEHIRVHPIITNGGTVVNAIPETVTMESYVRGASTQAIAETNDKVNRALAASAAALGANVTLSDRPGYSPLYHAPDLIPVALDAMGKVLKEVRHLPERWSTGCTDMGDVSCVIPSIHPFVGGVTGLEHGNTYRISDADAACVEPAKIQLLMLDALLKDGAKKALEVKANFKPVFANMQEYFVCIDKLDMDKKAVIYHENGNVTLDYRK